MISMLLFIPDISNLIIPGWWVYHDILQSHSITPSNAKSIASHSNLSARVLLLMPMLAVQNTDAFPREVFNKPCAFSSCSVERALHSPTGSCFLNDDDSLQRGLFASSGRALPSSEPLYVAVQGIALCIMAIIPLRFPRRWSRSGRARLLLWF
jgi:hypothetical protein